MATLEIWSKEHQFKVNEDRVMGPSPYVFKVAVALNKFKINLADGYALQQQLQGPVDRVTRRIAAPPVPRD